MSPQKEAPPNTCSSRPASADAPAGGRALSLGAGNRTPDEGEDGVSFDSIPCFALRCYWRSRPQGRFARLIVKRTLTSKEGYDAEKSQTRGSTDGHLP